MSLFITGTGTGVGKTIVTAGLSAVLQSRGQPFCVYKPAQTGSPDPARPEDPVTVQTLLGADVPTACSYSFPQPVAPYAADRGRAIQPDRFLADFARLQGEYSTVLVEGAGGVRVPVAPGFEMIDLMTRLRLPVVVVTHPGLGTINHTLLTVDALLPRGLTVKGVVISGMPDKPDDPAIQSLMATLTPFLRVPVLGALPRFETAPGSFRKTDVLKAFEALNLV